MRASLLLAASPVATYLPLALYLVAELACSIVWRRPLWLARQSLFVPLRAWGELRYFRYVLKSSRDLRSSKAWETMRSVKARSDVNATFAQPLFDQLRNYVEHARPVVVLGEPGAGKTSVLFAVRRHFTRQAWWSGVAAFLFVAFVFGSVLVWAPTWAWLLLLLGLAEWFVARWPVAVFVPLRTYNDGPFKTLAARNLASVPGGRWIAWSLSYYAQRGRLVWLLDGADEIRDDALLTAFQTFADALQPGGLMHGAGVVCTSGHGDNPAALLAVEDVLHVWDLDDLGVQRFLTIYDADDVDRQFAALKERQLLGGRAMGRNPYWLRVFVESGQCQRNRGLLMQNYCVQALQNGGAKVPPAELLEALAHLARRMNETGQVGCAVDFARTELDAARAAGGSGNWKSDDALAAAAAAELVLIDRSLRRVDFAHVVLQEFLSAFALRRQPEAALAHADDEAWWSTLSILGGLMPNPTAFVQRVLSGGDSRARLSLAVALLQNVDQPDERLVQQVSVGFVANLRGDASQEQIQAVNKLASVAPDTLGALLGAQFPGASLDVKRNVLRILDAIGGTYALLVITTYQVLADLTVRAEATRVLGRIGEPAVEPLIAAISVPQQPLTLELGEALEQIGGPAVEPLVEALIDDEHPCPAALEVLGWIGDARAVEPIVKLLRAKTTPEPLRSRATEALRRLGAAAVEPLIGVMNDAPDDVKLHAIAALGSLHDARAVEPLMEILRSKNDDVRIAALEALGQIGDARATDQLLYFLRNKTLKDLLRARSAEALGWVRSEEAVKALVEQLSDKRELVRAYAAVALGRTRDGRVVKPLLVPLVTAGETERVRMNASEAIVAIGFAGVPALAAALRSTDAKVRATAAEMLGRVGDVRAVEPLVQLLGDKEETVQLEAVSALGALADARALKPLLLTLRKPDAGVQVRARAARAIGKLGDKRAAPYLVESLADADDQVRAAVVSGLGQLGDAKFLEPLLKMLKDSDERVRWETADALGRLGDKRALEPLLQTFANPKEAAKTRMGAGDAIGRLGDRRAVAPLAALLADPTTEVRRGAVVGLGQLGDAAILPRLVETLRDADYWVRADAAEALSRLGDPRAFEPLLSAVEDENFWVRAEVARAFGRLRDLRAIKPLFRMLRDSKEAVRARAAAALGDLENPWALNPLLVAFRDDKDDVRIEAATALGRVGDLRAVKSLIAALHYEADQVRIRAALALARLGDARAIPALQPLAADTHNRLLAIAAREALAKLAPASPATSDYATAGASGEATAELVRSATMPEKASASAPVPPAAPAESEPAA